MERKHIPGKWGGAVGIEVEQTAPTTQNEEEARGESRGVTEVVEEVNLNTVSAYIKELISP